MHVLWLYELYFYLLERLDKGGLGTRKEKKFGKKSFLRIRPYIRPVIGQIVGRIGRDFWTKFHLATASNSAGNPAGYPANFRPDCDVALALSFRFQFSLEYYIKVLLYLSVWLLSFGSSFFRSLLNASYDFHAFLFSSPGESWAGSPLNPLVRLRRKWGRHSWYQSCFAWSLHGLSLDQVVLWSWFRECV